VCSECLGRGSFYRLGEQLREVTGANGEVVLRAVRGMGEDGVLFRVSRRSSRASSHGKWWSRVVESLTCLAVV
jgi:hypothetical protein